MKISFICLSAQLTFADLLLQAQLHVNTGDREGGRNRGVSDPTQSGKSHAGWYGGWRERMKLRRLPKMGSRLLWNLDLG